MPGHGHEKSLLPRGSQVMAYLEGLPGATLPEHSAGFAWPASGVKQASPNHYSSAWSIELARAAAALQKERSAENIERFERARAVVITVYFPREFQEGPLGVGLWGAEQLCPDGHGGQCLVGPTLCRVGAVLSGDAQLLEGSARLLRTNAQALLAVAAPDFAVWASGMRPVPKKTKGPSERLYNLPVSGVATEWLRELFGASHGKALHLGGALTDIQRKKVEANWRHPQYLAVRALRWLLQNDPLVLEWGVLRDRERKGEQFSGLVPAPCRLKLKMTVWRAQSEHLSVIDKPLTRPGGKPLVGVCDWCLCEYRPNGKHVITAGYDWQTPPPLPPKGAETIIFPGRER